jgi:putative ABC transport system permease protein
VPFSEAIRIAISSLRTNKLRSFLTVLGILIGVSSVVAVVAITDGLDRYVAEKVLELGTNSFAIQKFPDIITSFQQYVEMQKRRDFTLADVDGVRRVCGACEEVGGMVATNHDVKWSRTTQENVEIIGITENISRIGAVRDIIEGRQITQDDVDHARAVAVIGMDLVDAFFGHMEPLEKPISLGGHEVRVVGVADRKGTIFGESQDNFVWIPISTFQKLYGSRRTINIQVQAKSVALLETAEDQARMAVRVRRHLDYNKPDDFNLETGESVMELWQSATSGIYVVTIVVTAISLLVGGVVVMNIMLVSVTERTQEIGVRKALGARRRDILRQFLVESVILSAVGGLMGVLGAAAFSLLLASVIGGLLSAQFTAPIRLWAVVAALFVSTVVGLVAGIYPASRAAALDPVIALRNE